MSWTSRRRNLYLLTFGTISLVTIALIGFLVVYRAPTCADGKKNGDEAGVDCGGSCTLLCPATARAPIVHWSRAFEVKPGLWSAIAIVENPNKAAGVREAPYAFKLFDAENVLVAVREGVATLPAESIVPVFYANITTGSRIPARTFLELMDGLSFERDTPRGLYVNVDGLSRHDEGTAPRIEARLRNISGRDLPSFTVTAIVFDSAGNAIAASQTVASPIPRDGNESVVFTWPAPWSAAAARVEVLPTLPLP